MRVITGKDEKLWTVYAVSPSDLTAGHVEFLPERFRGGWLVFERTGERRRCAPTPQTWPDLPESDLLDLLEQAEVVPRRPAYAWEIDSHHGASPADGKSLSRESDSP